MPEGVVLIPVDLNPGGGCVRPVMMAFVAGTEPTATCGPAKYAPGVIAPGASQSRNEGTDQTTPSLALPRGLPAGVAPRPVPQSP